MPKLISFLLFYFLSLLLYGQSQSDSISKEYLSKIVYYLASDKLKGRVNYSAEQLDVASFINDELSNIGLKPLEGSNEFYWSFALENNSKRQGALLWNDKLMTRNDYFFFAHNKDEAVRKLNDFVVIEVSSSVSDSILYKNWKNDTPLLLWFNYPEDSDLVTLVGTVLIPAGYPLNDILIVKNPYRPKQLKFQADKLGTDLNLFNLIGLLPGKSRDSEVVIFSAHYDHVECKPVCNGANDNASGTAAVLALAKYFANRNDNERTIMFCLFAGEELGLYGSEAFSYMVDKRFVKAVINIEMIGRTNIGGKNAFLVTGSWTSDLSKIMSKNLNGEDVKVIERDWDKTRLFERSDNYSFYVKGIPSHSIMCSDDADPCYHQSCDDANKLDYENMERIVRAIAIGTHSIIKGIDTPSLYK